MHLRWAYILIVLGLLGVLSHLFLRVQRERALLETQQIVQQSSIVEGLRKSWETYLLENMDTDASGPAFSLRWNRQGSQLREEFFPNDIATMDWSSYRKSKSHPDERNAQKAFLEKALKLKNSWDRTLAMEEWQKLTGNFPNSETKYESTIINPEAKAAYKAIFSQFSSGRDFTFARPSLQFDQVFYFVAEDGSIVGFVPTIEQVQSLMDSFLQSKGLKEASFGATSLEIVFDEETWAKVGYQFIDWLIILGSFISILFGILALVFGIQQQRKEILKKVSFLNQVVHELKTPLTGLKLHLQLILSGAGQQKNFDALNVSISRLNLLFDDIVLMNRPYEKVDIIKLDALAGQKILKELQDEFSNMEIVQDFTSQWYADQSRTRIVLRNIIKNAIRYGKKAKITVQSHPENTIIFVEDEGPGIAKSEMKQIFTEFFRTDKAKHTNPDGLGLGLHIVAKLCHEMNARITVDNPGQPGARFRLELPGGNG
ncbi:MAG: HAMP domain-containing histidine kinase [Pseudobacteriovorax sp.]|nr:HAMP domain-containing histidine kinase [Pseudobacteriovorax sp.]